VKDREMVASLALSSRAWLPATDPETDRVRPLCAKHTPALFVRALTSPATRSTTYRCRVCGAWYEIVEVLA
jgi:hypothetical protein